MLTFFFSVHLSEFFRFSYCFLCRFLLTCYSLFDDLLHLGFRNHLFLRFVIGFSFFIFFFNYFSFFYFFSHVNSPHFKAAVGYLLTKFNVTIADMDKLLNNTLDMQFSSDSLRPPPYYFWLICFPIVDKSYHPFR